MKFKNKAHENAFYYFLSQMKENDSYHAAVAYLLSLNDTLTNNAVAVFDFKEDSIKSECIHKGFQTSSSLRATRLLFNLWNGNNYCDRNAGNDNLDTARHYTPSEIFADSDAEYYFEAVRLRYPWVRE